MHTVSATGNTAKGGAAGRQASPGLGEGGGLYIDGAALAYLDAFTEATVKKNKASTSDPDIHVSFTPSFPE